jgi:hypothetical protein
MAAALVSCSELRAPSEKSSATGPLTFEQPGAVDRAPLGPPAGYASGPSPTAPLRPAPQAAGLGQWQASPRWAAIRGDGCIEVKPDPHAAAGKVKVENCPEGEAEAKPRGETFGLPPE